MQAPASRQVPRIAVASSLATVLAFWLVWRTIRPDLTIHTGHYEGITPNHLQFMLVFGLASFMAAWLLGKGLTNLDEPSRSLLLASWLKPSDRVWVVVLMGVALSSSLATHLLVLQGMPLTDDESTYRFAAQLLANGQLYTESPPDKLFWDRGFMINDGLWYTQYFLGWPAVLAPFEALNADFLANPLLHAGTVPAWFLIFRRSVGNTWARVGSLLYVLGPMMLIESGLLMSHTATLFWVSWSAWLAWRATDEDRSLWFAAASAVAFSCAFFTRPNTALAMGLPILAWLAWHAIVRRRLAQLVAFLVPSLLCAGLFLGVNHAQNGSVISTAYYAAYTYTMENGYRFGHLSEQDALRDITIDQPLSQLGTTVIGLVRISFAGWGWLTLPFFFAVPFRRAAVFVAPVISYFVLHMVSHNAGIDLFGPTHYFELVLPMTGMLLWTFKAATERSALLFGVRPWALLTGFVATSMLCYTPIRMLSVRQASTHVRRPYDAAAALDSPSLVFVSFLRFALQCDPQATRHFHFHRPNPDPELTDQVLWVNHLSVTEDRAFRATRFPERRAYVQVTETEGCEVRLVDLDTAAADRIPDSAQTF